MKEGKSAFDRDASFALKGVAENFYILHKNQNCFLVLETLIALAVHKSEQ